MQGIEIRNAIDTKNNRLSIDDELLHAVLERRLDDPWIALRAIVPVAGDQAHAIAIALDPRPIAVVLDFAQPVRGMGNLGPSGRNAEVECFSHVSKR